jgi:hypothetical protein
MVGKVKWKSLELSLPGKMVSQKQYRIPGMTEISANIKALMQGKCRERCRGVVPPHPHSTLFGLCRR